MNYTKEIKNYKKRIEKLINILDTKTDSSAKIDLKIIEDIKKINRTFDEQIKEAEDINRKLRLGIIGQVKSGKSSFLNALFFNGENILPKAATPMTAALTILTYGENNKAVVHFYSTKDWQTIKKQDLEYRKEEEKIKKDLKTQRDLEKDKKQISNEEIKKTIDSKMPEEFKSSRELIDMAKNISNIESLLGTEKVIEGIADINDLMGKLKDYVGSDGEFTPLTKNLELELNIETLKNIEVADAHGVKDPIISRANIKDKFLKHWD